MSNTEDYHVNTQFKMGGGMATPPLQIQQQKFATNNNNNNNTVIPPIVAPATTRMMRKSQQGQQLSSPISNTDTPNTHTPQPQPQPQQQKQFHRKSLGDWDFLDTIGAGSMGKVKLARHHQTNEICAIKIINRATKAFLHKEQSLPPPKTEQELLTRQKKLEKEISRDKRTIREASLGQVLYHPHICRLFEMCTMSNHFYMLFEYVSGGQLLDYIIQHGSLREHHARKFARGIASALEYLHGNNIVHRDLKIENIMISTSGEIKIIDFGLSNVFDKKKQLHTFCGSLYFAAPELLKANPYTGPEVDVWSFGVVLYVLVCGKVPFDDEVSSVLHEKIKQGKVEYPNHLSIEVISLLSKMLVVDPSRRASLKQVIDHPWMNRGYDTHTKSYLPQRIPLTVEMLDSNVIKEMFRLEFIDNIDDTKEILSKIVTEFEYVNLSRQYWEQVSYLKRINSNVTSSNNQNLMIDDPTRSYNPLLSMYYLVSEMLERKLAKLRRKEAQMAKLQQISNQSIQQQHIANQPALQQKSNNTNEQNSLQQPVQVQRNPVATMMRTPPSSNNNIPQLNINQQQSTDNKRIPSLDKKPSVNSPMNIRVDTGNNTNASPSAPLPLLKSPSKRPVPKYNSTTNGLREGKPLQIMVPPKLAMPQQAHTSPTSRKSSDNHDVLDNVTSPVPAETDYYSVHHQQQMLSPADSNKSFGGIFRKLSQHRQQQSQSPTLQPPARDDNNTNGAAESYGIQLNPQASAKTSNSTNLPNNTNHLNISNARGTKKTHTRTVSEYIPSVTRTPSYGVPIDHVNNVITPPMRSASQKQPKKTDLPALPSNAEILLQQQREKQVEKDMGNLNVSTETGPQSARPFQVTTQQQNQPEITEDDEFNTSIDDQPVQPLNVIKGRKYHPSARAKSVGHARRESLKFSRPPVPPTPTVGTYPQGVEDTGFLQFSDDSKSDSTRNVSTNMASSDNNKNGSGSIRHMGHGNGEDTSMSFMHYLPELTDEQILAEAAKAPPGSMLSIDYPRSLFLKGFFSVQTTSSKPLPIVRYKIIYVLKKLNIEFKEVKGGFICVQKHPGEQLDNSEKKDGPLQQPLTQTNTNLKVPSSIDGRRNVSRHSSIRRQHSLKQAYPGIPNTPSNFNHHERNVSLIASPISAQVGLNNISQELSSASIDDFNSPDDMLTTSKVQDMNLTGNENGEDSKERQPIKFEIHIVKVRIVGLAGVHFKKVSGNTWLYKELASNILKDLNL